MSIRSVRLPICRLVLLLLPLLLAGPASHGAPENFNLGSYGSPSVAEHGGKPLICTVTYLVQDDATNQTYAARMQFEPSPDATVGPNGRMQCPGMMPPTVGEAALNGCRSHAAQATNCVFADMDKGFSAAPSVGNTSAGRSRCGSDEASQIAIACLLSGGREVCNVGCGEEPDAAVKAARQRCEATHGKACNITGWVPVEAP
ncbi:MAG TPA: hypothetical protein VMB73_21085 [Acetobacteraceae bacterium]|nr:hypothetical protein [Acetobacteraceae bacterium]